MGYQEPYHQRSAERKKREGPRGPNRRRTSQTIGRHSRAFPYGCPSVRSKWFAGRRIVGTQMGGCGFQEKRHLHPALDCEPENWAAKNRSSTKSNSDELRLGQGHSPLEAEHP